MGKRVARVNCVDINSREVIEQFIFDIQVDKPTVDRTIEVVSKTGVDHLFKVEFPLKRDILKLGKQTTFTVSTNNAKLLAPVSQFIKVDPNMLKIIEVVVPKQADAGESEAIL